MSNFDAKFGPEPVHVLDEARILGVQFLVVFVLAYAIEPSFLNAPKTTTTSAFLSLVFSALSVVATVVVHRSFRAPGQK